MFTMKAVNWNRPDDDFTQTFWQQNVMQFWTDEEIPLSDDKMDWELMSTEERTLYKNVLGGLTLLDTVQGGIGMPKVLEHVEGLQRKAVLGFMAMMEQIHAKSYSSIFTTLASNEEIDEIGLKRTHSFKKKRTLLQAGITALKRNKICIVQWQLPYC
jgi:ribonucleoside-diphosphate reductase beta chain